MKAAMAGGKSRKKKWAKGKVTGVHGWGGDWLQKTDVSDLGKRNIIFKK